MTSFNCERREGGRMADKDHKYDVFLSYSRRDLDWVGAFVEALHAGGVQSWFDVADLEPGTRWEDEREGALRESRTLVVILSSNSIDSLTIYFEVGAAVADQKRIIPVLTDDLHLSQIPPLLRRFQVLRESSASAAGRRVAEVITKLQSTQEWTPAPAASDA